MSVRPGLLPHLLIVLFHFILRSEGLPVCSGKEYPLTGLWSDKTSPHFSPYACSLQTKTLADISTCTANRTFIFAGNSVMRGYSFKFAEFTKGLPGSVVTRDSQKAMCSKEPKNEYSYESCSLGAGTGRVRFIWQLFFGEAPQDSLQMDHGKDFCSGRGFSECLGPLLRDSGPFDVFSFHYGIIYALMLTIYPAHASYRLEQLLSQKTIIDFFSFVDANFKGLYKVWVTTPHPRNKVGDVYFAHLSAIDQLVKSSLTLYLANNTKLEPSWRILDAQSIAAQAEHTFDDDFHHFGPVSQTVVENMLSFVCLGRAGEKLDSYRPDLLSTNLSTNLVPLSSKPLFMNSPIARRDVVFWDSSLHDGTRIEVTTQVLATNSSIFPACGAKRQKNPYSSYFVSPNVLWPARWAPELNIYTSHSMNLLERHVKTFYEFYKSDEQFRNVDVVVCAFPMSFCEIYLSFNKTILWLAAHRYSIGRCSTATWTRLNEHITASVSGDGTKTARSVIAGMNMYDVEYINYYTGLNATLIEATGSLYGALSTRYTQSRNEILIGPSQGNHLEESKLKSLYVACNSFVLKSPKELYGHYHLADLASHRAVVMFPYAVHSYGILEFYALGIPMFVPTPEFLLELHVLIDFQVNAPFYCGRNIIPPPKHSTSLHPFSPEDTKREAILYWLQFADFYRWPHITRFGSFEDLNTKLLSANFSDIHNKMMVENQRRLEAEQFQYQQLVNRVASSPKRITPSLSYKDAIKSLWGVDKLQVDY